MYRHQVQQPPRHHVSLLPTLPPLFSPRSRDVSPDDNDPPPSPTTPTASSYFSGLDTGNEPWHKRVKASRSPKVVQQSLDSVVQLQTPPATRVPTLEDLQVITAAVNSESSSISQTQAHAESSTSGSGLGLGEMSSNSGAPLKRKVVIMGSPSVGKTSLTQQWIQPPTYNEAYFPTIENTSHKTIKFDGVEYDCEVIDSAGQDEYTLFPSKYAVGVHGYLLVYSINSRQSFEMIQTVHDKILDFSGLEKVPCVVIGQKVDLSNSERRVTYAEGEAVAKKLGAAFIESSAKDNKNVGKAFEVLLKEMQKEYNPAPEKKKSSWWGWGS